MCVKPGPSEEEVVGNNRRTGFEVGGGTWVGRGTDEGPRDNPGIYEVLYIQPTTKVTSDFTTTL